jgi:WD40 repeat protein
MQKSVNESSGDVVLTYTNHLNATSLVAWSPDGRYVATNTTRESMAQVWDARTGQLVSSHKCERDRQGYVAGLVWSPDGRYLASGQNGLRSDEAIAEAFLAGRMDVSMNGVVEVWEALTGRTVMTLEGFFGRVWAASPLAWSPDGEYLAFGNHAKRALVKKAVSDRTVATHEGPYADWLTSIAWSPNGKYIASACGDKAVYVWQALTGKTIDTYQGHSGSVYCVAWSPDGRYVASASADRTVQIWTPVGGTVFTYREHADTVNALAWSPDGKALVSTSNDGTAQVWEALTGKTLTSYRDHAKYVSAVAWSPDDNSIVTTAYGAAVWNSKSSEVSLRFGDTLSNINDISVAPGGKYVASTAHDEIQVWDARTGTKQFAYHGHNDEQGGFVSSIAWSPDGAHIASVCSIDAARHSGHRARIHLWQTTGETPGSLVSNWTCHADAVHELCWSPDGLRLASSSFDGTVQIWQAATGAPVLTYDSEGGHCVALAWSSDGRTMATSCWYRDKDAYQGKNVAKRLAAQLTHTSNTVFVWNADTGETLTTYTEHSENARALAWSPDGRFIASGGGDQSVRIWEALSGKTLLTLRGHQESVTTVAWSPDGRTVASGSWDKTIRVWDAATGELIFTYTGHTGSIEKLVWLPDSKHIVSASYGVHIWRAVM